MGLSDKKCSLQRNCVVLPTENWLGSSLNQIQGWTTVRESYSRALEQGPLVLSNVSNVTYECWYSDGHVVIGPSLQHLLVRLEHLVLGQGLVVGFQ